MSIISKDGFSIALQAIKKLISLKADKSEVATKVDRSEFSDAASLELVVELELVDPVVADDGSIYTDENGIIYSI